MLIHAKTRFWCSFNKYSGTRQDTHKSNQYMCVSNFSTGTHFSKISQFNCSRTNNCTESRGVYLNISGCTTDNTSSIVFFISKIPKCMTKVWDNGFMYHGHLRCNKLGLQLLPTQDANKIWIRVCIKTMEFFPTMQYDSLSRQYHDITILYM